MRIRRIAVLIDGGFFIKRLSKLAEPAFRNSPKTVANSARVLCKRHVRNLIGERGDSRKSRWLDHVYRLFYYDAAPFDQVAHHPISNLQIDFAKTPEAKFRLELFAEIRRLRKFALRLGKVTKEDDWHIKNTGLTKKLLRTHQFLNVLEAAADAVPPPALTQLQCQQLANIAAAWRGLTPDDLRLGLRQKGVDMRIGIDIATLTLKKQVDTIILVTGDSDFVPAAKLARREGVEFLLDPLWQQVNDDLHEHVDGIVSGFQRPGAARDAAEDDDEETNGGPPPPGT
ncbi:MAG: NYN domain-containing protein [Verrucomicrobia bacterium]|nr:NYN domain-containing protein [Verrucomicrobiota bacterium]